MKLSNKEIRNLQEGNTIKLVFGDSPMAVEFIGKLIQVREDSEGYKITLIGYLKGGKDVKTATFNLNDKRVDIKLYRSRLSGSLGQEVVQKTLQYLEYRKKRKEEIDKFTDTVYILKEQVNSGGYFLTEGVLNEYIIVEGAGKTSGMLTLDKVLKGNHDNCECCRGRWENNPKLLKKEVVKRMGIMEEENNKKGNVSVLRRDGKVKTILLNDTELDKLKITTVY